MKRRSIEPETPRQVGLFSLPYFKDESSCLGVVVVYGPPRCGKTTIVSRMADRLMSMIEFDTIAIFCPGTRGEWKDLEKRAPEKTLYVMEHEDFAMRTIVRNQVELAKKKLPNKLLMIWDDQVGTTSMHKGSLEKICKKFAACGRQEENNVCWFVCAQSPSFCNPTVRQSARLIMFSQCGPSAVELILDSSQVHVSEDDAFSIAFEHQFVVLDNVSHRAYVVKTSPMVRKEESSCVLM